MHTQETRDRARARENKTAADGQSDLRPASERSRLPRCII